MASSVMLSKVAALAHEADEQGYPLLAVALGFIVRSADLPPYCKIAAANSVGCMLDAIDEARRGKRRYVKAT